jgi:hypothetical protein
MDERDIATDGPVVSQGDHYEVRLVHWKGEPYAVKRVSPAPVAGDTLVAACQRSNPSVVFCDCNIAPPEALTRPLLSSLLGLEAERIRASQGAWHHRVEALLPMQGQAGAPLELALVTPWAQGTSFTAQPERARRRLQQVLPGLLRALAAAPHGDLQPDHLILSTDGERVALLDPGVALRRHRHEDAFEVDEVLLVTSPAHYPLLPPGYDGYMAKEFDLGTHVAAALSPVVPAPLERGLLALGPAAPRPHLWPRPADLMALGIVLHGVLTGKHPFWDHPAWPRDAPHKPAWWGGGGGPMGPSMHDHRAPYLAVLEAGLLPPSFHDARITAAEERLVQSLLRLRYDSRSRRLLA